MTDRVRHAVVELHPCCPACGYRLRTPVEASASAPDVFVIVGCVGCERVCRAMFWQSQQPGGVSVLDRERPQ